MCKRHIEQGLVTAIPRREAHRSTATVCELAASVEKNQVAGTLLLSNQANFSGIHIPIIGTMLLLNHLKHVFTNVSPINHEKYQRLLYMSPHSSLE